MLKYVTISTAAKAFSVNSMTRSLYRSLGNRVLERQRSKSGLDSRYVERAVKLVDVCDKHDLLHPGDHVLELGTGWLHWEATVLRCFYDIEATLYDVWDNRLLGAYQDWMGEFSLAIDAAFGHLPEPRRARARETAAAASSAESFEELYELFGFTYVVDESGTLSGVPASSFQLAVSADVLEHVEEELLPGYLETLNGVLNPRGWLVNQIDLVDHFHYFDTRTSPKNYYKYGDDAWRRFFSSEVQYVNRVQRPTWLSLFSDAGFELVEEQMVSGEIGDITLADRFSELSTEDRNCMQTMLVHQSLA